jgi:hypothetical protein
MHKDLSLVEVFKSIDGENPVSDHFNEIFSCMGFLFHFYYNFTFLSFNVTSRYCSRGARELFRIIGPV